MMRPRQRTTSGPAVRRTHPLLVTGGAGFIGCNLADRLAREGEHVLVLDHLRRPGVERNLRWLQRRHPRRISTVIADIRDHAAADAVADAAGVFHLAAQVAVTTSLDDPLADLDVNVRGTVRLLEAVRARRDPPSFVFASTNKVYGDLADIALDTMEEAVRPRDTAFARHGIGEDRPLAFHTPYGCSKGAADQYVLDYARTWKLPATVLRMSCIYGPHQCGCEDQGWVAHFLISARDGAPITIFGDGRQVRDVLYVEDAVEAYVRAHRRIGRVAGHAFNLGGGPENAVSLRDVLNAMRDLPLPQPQVRFAPERPSDQRYYVSDPRRIWRALNLDRPRHWRDGLHRLARWLMDDAPRSRPAASTFAAEASR
jgi:CDP-paratose 2-epimerase